MTEKDFINWLRSYMKSAPDTEDNILIATMLSTVIEDVQSNPYWSSVTATENVKLNYNVVVDPKTNTYSAINYKEDETR